jgi:hypothetical protein
VGLNRLKIVVKFHIQDRMKANVQRPLWEAFKSLFCHEPKKHDTHTPRTSLGMSGPSEFETVSLEMREQSKSWQTRHNSTRNQHHQRPSHTCRPLKPTTRPLTILSYTPTIKVRKVILLSCLVRSLVVSSHHNSYRFRF